MSNFNFIFEALEVDDDKEDNDGGHQVEKVGRGGSVEGLVECGDFVGAGEEHVHCGDNCAFVFDVAGLIGDSEGGKGFPDDVLADVDGNEEGNA